MRYIVFVVILLNCVFCSADCRFVVTNNSGAPLYVYDVDLSVESPTGLVGILQPDKSLSIVLKTVQNPSQKVGRRMYVASGNLKTVEAHGGKLLPDGFCTWNDGNVMFSFVEYLYEPSKKQYTVDMSYIDEFSYPITLRFSGGDHPGYQNNFEYGFKSLDKVVRALKAKGDPWDHLVWDSNNPANPGHADWHKGIRRIVGPNKLWTSQASGKMTDYAPNGYHVFVRALPYDGVQLFKTSKNFDGWRFSTTLPAKTGYVEALRSTCVPDKRGKYGFFTYCEDNANGEFTNVPMTTSCSITVYH